MTALPKLRHVHNFTPWPLSQQDLYGSWGWLPIGGGANSYPTRHKARFEHVGGTTTTPRGLEARIYNCRVGDRFIFRATYSNVVGSLNGLTMLCNQSKCTNFTILGHPGTGHNFIKFECATAGMIEVWLGIGLVVGETSAINGSFEVTAVAVQRLPSGTTVPMDYHGLLDDEGDDWGMDEDKHTYNGDKSRVAFDRDGDVVVTGQTFTETYGSNTSPRNTSAVAVYGDSLMADTQVRTSLTAQINLKRDDVTLYGDTVGGHQLRGMTAGSIARTMYYAERWGGQAPSRVIIQRCVNDMWAGTGIQTGELALARAAELAVACMSFGLPVMFFTAAPVFESYWLAVPEGENALLTYNANIESRARAAVEAEGYDGDNIHIHDWQGYLEDPARPGSHVLNPAFERPVPQNDGIHHNQAGYDRTYLEFVTNGVLDDFINFDFIERPVQVYQNQQGRVRRGPGVPGAPMRAQ